MGSPHALVVVLALLSFVAARSFGGGGGSGVTTNFSNAHALEVANLFVNAVLLFATLVQLVFSIPVLFRSGLRLLAASMIAALTVMFIAYMLNVASVVDTLMLQEMSGVRNVNMRSASSLFSKWTDSAVLAAVFLVLRNRYCNVHAPSPVAIVWFTSIACLLLGTIVVLITAQVGLTSAIYLAEHRQEISEYEANGHVQTATDILYVYVVLNFLVTLFLAVTTFLVKSRTKRDKISSLILFTVVPLLFLHAMARIIFTILAALLPRFDSYPPERLDFSATVVYGVLHLTVTTLLVSIITRTRLWETTRLPARGTLPVMAPPQIVVQRISPSQFSKQWRYPPEPQKSHSQESLLFANSHQRQRKDLPLYPIQNIGLSRHPFSAMYH